MGRYGYGFWNFVLDFVLIAITGGLWIIWIIFREIRNSRREREYMMRRWGR